ncbi:YggS family pyridoxal phosphate-dependent enzyme [Crateriforma conspicua]|uniref:Pyridoxal phosphate homeostasis protein n=1 Tax=Crateriforma conspicua TaxID=2527996 RepID=A0A5C5YA39_9PLAN|nr:YggS family pyridoxal phosphate-dependent enzyme [Crateriforma conspicua]QDV61932.1 Pyridoxal phosphate homeostasis protein [Crateriforma conspicua]TWT71819.1 Pyridoxal phosphate homeostasis protein [Crateriforma conspicua]
MTETLQRLDEASFQRLRDNWQSVVDDVAEATHQAGRDPNTVQIIGVTKYVDANLTAALCEIGCQDLGENRPQVLWKKAEQMAPEALAAAGYANAAPRWHQIGHLQSNKVRRLLRHRPMIHSIDSQKLLDVVAQQSVDAGITTTCLLEVNISGEQAKTGMAIDDTRRCFDAGIPTGVQVDGLMAMASLHGGQDDAAAQFDRLRMLRDEFQEKYSRPLPTLSMGMSGDFPAAIAAGATMVRIGSRIFAGLM